MCFLNKNQLSQVLCTPKPDSCTSCRYSAVCRIRPFKNTPCTEEGERGMNANDFGDNLPFPMYIHPLSKHRRLQQLGCFKINHAALPPPFFFLPACLLLNESEAQNNIPSAPNPSVLELLSGAAWCVCVAINLPRFCCEASRSPALRA